MHFWGEETVYTNNEHSPVFNIIFLALQCVCVCVYVCVCVEEIEREKVFVSVRRKVKYFLGLIQLKKGKFADILTPTNFLEKNKFSVFVSNTTYLRKQSTFQKLKNLFLGALKTSI